MKGGDQSGRGAVELFPSSSCARRGGVLADRDRATDQERKSVVRRRNVLVQVTREKRYETVRGVRSTIAGKVNLGH